jgi:hypothetical protein
MLGEADVRAQVLGLSVIRLGDDLAASVLDLLVERGHGLVPGLPLSIFGGLPVRDRRAGPARAGTAAHIAALIADAARRIPRVVLVPARAGRDEPLFAATVERVVHAVQREPAAPGSPGGLLVVLEDTARVLDTRCDRSYVVAKRTG